MTGEQRFAAGDVVVRREVLLGEAWFAFATICVADTDDGLVLYLPPGTEFGFPDKGTFPAGRHPWLGQHIHWRGHGKLMLHRPGEAHSVDVFWSGEDRTFSGWYFNIQDPYRRTAQGIDTLDHELDIWWPASTDRYQWKDVEKFEERVLEGRYPGFDDEIRAEGKRIAADLDAGRRWWDESWSDWRPDPSWAIPALPADWADVPLTHRP
jgi:Protein of unknown function (DUF402)